MATLRPMYPSTPPTIDLSRPRLKALTRWIRDDLDLLVAREGPNILRPDDVLTLHETFVQLRLSSTITVLDLRATGIHRAIQDIAGVATRWPGRLCDDCDRIVALWSEKFGPFSELRPFLYGRGGRLEGIASAAEHSRDALLKRWSETCPEKLHPKVSHRQGDLGFRAGDWWINTLFAHHAGIIGLEAVEGGTTFDKHGAYALVLKDTGEVEATSEERFTYRVPQGDKGRYRLTAATRASRDPIRVLRSHSINSIWGPKAGVRYEGLYSVTGWSIRQAKKPENASVPWKEGDVVFEVCFVRRDPVLMDEVTKRPTTTEVDDYSEYKRLRKLHREGKRKVHETTGTALANFQQPVKAAPPIMPLMPIPTRLTPRSSPGPSRKPTFKRPHFDIPEDITPDLSSAGMSPRTIGETDYFHFSPAKSSTLLVPTRSSIRPTAQSSGDVSPTVTPVLTSPSAVSVASSNNTRASGQANIQEVAPWVELDAEGSIQSSDDTAPSDIKSNGTLSPGTADKKRPRRRHSPTSTPRRDRRKSGDVSLSSKSKDSRKSIFVRSRNPMAKLFDGAASEYDEGDFANAMDETASSLRRKEQRSEEVHVVYSPVPIRVLLFGTPGSRSPVKGKRRGAVYTSLEGSGEMGVGVGGGMGSGDDDDPFVDENSTRALAMLPALNFSTRPRDGTRSSSPLSSADRRAVGRGSKVVFRNPFVRFNEQENGGKYEEKNDGEVAPDVVC